MGNRGINVPPSNALYQWYKNSTVTEAFEIEEDRNTRYDQLVMLARNPIKFYSHDSGYYMIEWTEPRGAECS